MTLDDVRKMSLRDLFLSQRHRDYEGTLASFELEQRLKTLEDMCDGGMPIDPCAAEFRLSELVLGVSP